MRGRGPKNGTLPRLRGWTPSPTPQSLRGDAAGGFRRSRLITRRGICAERVRAPGDKFTDSGRISVALGALARAGTEYQFGGGGIGER